MGANPTTIAASLAALILGAAATYAITTKQPDLQPAPTSQVTELPAPNAPCDRRFNGAQYMSGDGTLLCGASTQGHKWMNAGSQDSYLAPSRVLTTGHEFHTTGDDFLKGTWIGVSETPDARCLADVQDANGSILVQPVSKVSPTGGLVTFIVGPSAAFITLSGDCLWNRLVQ